jgi:hypothetical protein
MRTTLAALANRNGWYALLLMALATGAGLGIRQLYYGATAPAEEELWLVLPFRNASAVAAGDAGEAVMDALTAALGAIAHPTDDLSVTEWSTYEIDDQLALRRARTFARSLGATHVVRGTVTIVADTARIEAAAHRTVDGRMVASAATSGPADSLPAVIPSLATALLRTAEPARVTMSARALEQYLCARAAFRRGHVAEANVRLRAALAYDTDFVQAAVLLHRAQLRQVGDPAFGADSLLLQAAWEQRHRLGRADHEYVLALVGRNYPANTSMLLRLGDWKRLTRSWPRRAEAWYGWAYANLHWAAFFDLPDTLAARDAAFGYSRALENDSTFDAALLGLFHHAIAADPTAAVAIGERYLARPTPAHDAGVRAALAVLKNDSDGVSAVLMAIDTAAPAIVAHMVEALRALQEPGSLARIATARVIARASRESAFLAAAWPLAWRLANDAGLTMAAGRILDTATHAGHIDSVSYHATRIRAALFWDGDTAAAAASAAWLRDALDAMPADVRPTDALCVLGQWQAATDDSTSINGLVNVIRSRGIGTPRRCADMLELWIAVRTGAPDASRRAAAFDSLASRGNFGGRQGHEQNLVLARAFELLGSPASALRVLGRYPLYNRNDPFYRSTFERERARLAFAVGDSAAANTAFARFAAWRDREEPGPERVSPSAPRAASTPARAPRR